MNAWIVCGIFVIIAGCVFAYPIWCIRHDSHRIFNAAGGRRPLVRERRGRKPGPMVVARA